MKVIDAVKQMFGGNREFTAEDKAVGTEAAEIIDAVKDGAKQEAEQGIKDRMAALETAEADMKEKIDAAKAETATALETERARVAGVLAAAAPLHLDVEDVGAVLAAQKDGTFQTLEQAKDALIVESGKKNAGLKTPDGRQESPENDDEADASRAMDAAVERRSA